MQQKVIYLDYNSTTPVAEEVIKEMLPYFNVHYGNPSSNDHPYGWKAKEAIEQARERLARLISCESKEIILTSGATEAINLALKGCFESARERKNHIITVKTEHKAVLSCCNKIEQKGGKVTYLNVDKTGLLDIDHLKENITNDTFLVCVMLVNNETGVIQPIDKISQICKKYKILLLCDATQAMDKISIDVNKLGIDLMAFSSHKMYGPKGVGALYINLKNENLKLNAQIDGGGQEMNFRSGTLNVPGIIGFGKAADLIINSKGDNPIDINGLRNYLESSLLELKDVEVIGSKVNRVSNVSDLLFRGVNSEKLILSLNHRIAVSNGSACNSYDIKPSHVLKAMNYSDEEAFSSIRFSLGRYTTFDEIEQAIQTVKKSVHLIRNKSRLIHFSIFN